MSLPPPALDQKLADDDDVPQHVAAAGTAWSTSPCRARGASSPSPRARRRGRRAICAETRTSRPRALRPLRARDRPVRQEIDIRAGGALLPAVLHRHRRHVAQAPERGRRARPSTRSRSGRRARSRPSSTRRTRRSALSVASRTSPSGASTFPSRRATTTTTTVRGRATVDRRVLGLGLGRRRRRRRRGRRFCDCKSGAPALRDSARV